VLKESATCSIRWNGRTGPYVPRERIEVTITQRKRNAEPDSKVKVHQREQTAEIEVKGKRLARGEMKERIRERWPELNDLRHTYEFPANQREYWTDGTEVTVRELGV
jgi:Tfp pilus assembly protein FimV